MRTANRRHVALLLGLLSVVLWSTTATAFKIALAHGDVYHLLCISTLTSALLLTLAAKIRGQQVFRHRRDVYAAISRGLLGPVLYYLVLLNAYDRLPAQIAQPVNFTWSITLAWMSVLLLGQRLNLADVVAMAVCYSGVVIMTTRGETSLQVDGTGVALALASTLLWAGYWILGMREQRAPLAALAGNFLAAAPLTCLLALLLSDFSRVDYVGIAAAAYVGVFEMGIAFVAWGLALRLADNVSRVGNLVFLSPVISLLLIQQVLGEPIHPASWLGLAAILAGLGIQQWGAATTRPTVGKAKVQ